MKFENDYIRIIIERKKLSEEQQEAEKKKWRKRRPAMLVALLLIVAIISGVIYSRFHGAEEEQQILAEAEGNASGSKKPENEIGGAPPETKESDGKDGADAEEEYGQIEGEYIVTAHLASGLHDKYADQSLYNYTYGEPVENVGRDEAITFELGYDVADLGIDKWTEVFALYQDPELTELVGTKFSFDSKTGVFTMQPSDSFSLYSISILGLDTETVDKYPHSESCLFDKGAGNNWGNLGTAYLASYRDKETGELLDKPEVSIVTFKGEIEEAPKLTYSITDDGRPEFCWNEVEGATEYFVCQIWKTKGQEYANSVSILGITEDTTWVTELPDYSSSSTVNTEFRTFRISEDEWKNEGTYDYYLELYGEPDIPHYDTGEFAEEKGICVIAVNSQGTSMISNTFSNTELASNLPYSEAFYTARENGFIGNIRSYEEVENLPIYYYVTMCDGYTNMKLVDYQTEKAYVQDDRFMIVDPDTGEMVGAETYPSLHIPYRVEGTPFTYELSVSGTESGYNEADMQKDLDFLEDREEKLRKKSGAVAPEFSLQLATHEDLKPEKIRQVDTTIFANSALSEYLAVNMLGGVNTIDLSEFPEAKDKNFVDDAFMEAYYQNPLILGIKGYRINNSGTAVRVVYEESLESQAKKQEKIKEKVSEIIDDIITEDMTDQEKELAINQYLCDTVVYDEDALANAEMYNYRYVDDEFNDSFSAYGALLNGKCVCAGYAAAFKLLAQEAGLEAIVVTGFLDGSLSHAWNKVKIDDEWQIVDVTNNDNEYFFNALLNLPSSVGDRVLVEDKSYMLDKVIPDYIGESDSNEYYHITDNYFPVQEVAEKLSAELAENGYATLRTDYELNDEKFYEITDAVYEIMGDDTDLYGYYWIGVIYLSTEG